MPSGVAIGVAIINLDFLHRLVPNSPFLFSSMSSSADQSAQPADEKSCSLTPNQSTPTEAAEKNDQSVCKAAQNGVLCPHVSCWKHCLIGGLRGFLTGYTTRSAFMFSISLLSSRLWGKDRARVLSECFGEDSVCHLCFSSWNQLGVICPNFEITKYCYIYFCFCSRFGLAALWAA